MTYSFGWLLMAGAGLFREKNTAGWLLVCSERKVLLAGGSLVITRGTFFNIWTNAWLRPNFGAL
jgi:hypothetical protein